MVERICSFEGCSGKVSGRGLCAGHYRQLRRMRPLTPIAPRGTTAERFWAKVEKTDTCWLWIGAASSWGYGNFRNANGRTKSAHRWSYEDANGAVPDGLHLDHLCRVTLCVNPDHLEPVTPRENLMRGIGPAAARWQNVPQTHCKHGHELTSDNTYVRPATGHRYCRTCQRERHNEWAARQGA